MSDLDQRVSRLRAASSYDEATTAILEELGPQVFRYLVARARDVALASDAFSRFSEDLWAGMAGFAGKSSVRVWAYAIARNALAQEIRGQKRHRARRGDFSDTLSSRIADKIRTETAAWHRTEAKDNFLKLQQELDQDEKELLFLRTKQKLGWDEIAAVHLGEAASAAELKREAARLRKRFQLTREKLRKLARQRGLLGEQNPRGTGSS